jgi:hypothetical protein
MKKGWQEHPSTKTAHYFSVAESGQMSICNRETFVTDGKLYKEARFHPCSFCLKKIDKQVRSK